jgi:diguanylate cyclase (GGDEF)-like protein/PAS domain S-box-containing protein
MVSNYSIISFILLLSALASVVAMVFVWMRRKPGEGRGALILYQFGTFIWALTYSLYWLNSPSPAAVFWLNMTYFGVTIVPGALFLFVMDHLGYSSWLKPPRVYFIWVEPLITLVVLWTDRFHHLFYGLNWNPAQSEIYTGGIWFWVNVIYIYGLTIVCIIFLILAVIHRAELNKRQAQVILAAILFPILGNFISFIGLDPIKGLDITPILFTITAVVITIADIYYHLFDLLPIARDVLVEHMQEGMLLFDGNGLLIDMNPAARSMLNLPGESQVGKESREVFKDYPQLISLLGQKDGPSVEITLNQTTDQILEVKYEPVQDPRAGTGVLLICRDISQQKQTENQLREQMDEITSLQASLREQAIRDPLTGLYNRRYLQDTLPRELAQAHRENQQLSLVMLDLDGFKLLNDTYGHSAGDEVLIKLSVFLQNNTRAGDIVVRYGGEEFLIVLINTTSDIALDRVEKWRELFATSPIEYDSARISLTFSAGIAESDIFGISSEKLINLADTALYQAKAAGKNCTVVHKRD